MALTNTDIAKMVSSKTGICLGVSMTILETYLQYITEHLAKKRFISIPGIGKIMVRKSNLKDRNNKNLNCILLMPAQALKEYLNSN